MESTESRKNSKIGFIVVVGIVSLLLIAVLVLIFLIIVFQTDKKVIIERNEYHQEEEVGISYNGEFLGSIPSHQEPNDLNFQNQVDGMLFFPMGDLEEGENLYECVIDYRCAVDNNNERRQCPDPIDYVMGKLRLYVVGLYETIEQFIRGKINEYGMGDCETSKPDCKKLDLKKDSTNEGSWLCDASCDEGGLVMSMTCWVGGYESLDFAKLVSTGYFKNKCLDGDITVNLGKVCRRNPEGIIGALFRVDSCERLEI